MSKRSTLSFHLPASTYPYAINALVAKRLPFLPLLPPLELPPLELLPALTVLLLLPATAATLELAALAAATDVAAADELATELAATAEAAPLSLTRNFVQSSWAPRWATGIRTG